MIGSATRARAFLAAIGAMAVVCVWGAAVTPAATVAAGRVASTSAPASGERPVAAAQAPGTVAAPPVAAADPAVEMRPLAFTSASPGQAAAVAVAFALHQIGVPYVWGGDGPAAGDIGFDCSGLTQAAYGAAGISLPRTAQTQYDAGPHLAASTVLQAGDLVFYGTPTHVHHVGIALDAHRMVNAPHFGQPVQVATIRGAGDDYVGATRPAAGTVATGPLVLPAPVQALLVAVPVTSGPPPAAPAPTAVTTTVAAPSQAPTSAALPSAAPTSAIPTSAAPTSRAPTSRAAPTTSPPTSTTSPPTSTTTMAATATATP